MRPDVQVRFKYFPLSGECNPALPKTGSGQERCDAAFAAECAHQQGKFWEMSSQLFTNQGYFGPDELQFMAKEVGMDLNAYATCMADPSMQQRVAAAGQAGDTAGVAGTPAMFVKGLVPGKWVEVPRGAPTILRLLEALDGGASLPAPQGS